jgi:hypothetical protein
MEVQGGGQFGRHSRIVGQAKDCEKLSRAAILGWRVLTCNAINVDNGDAARWCEEALSN